jgi:hypothetical protein
VKWGKTTFYWDTVDPSSGPREDYAPGAKRAIATITVTDGSPAGRVQAARDLIGYATLGTDKVGTNLATYMRRTNPLPYPGSDNLYCYSLVNGSGLGVASHGADGVSFSGGYQFQAVFTSRTYQIKEDRDVKAQEAAAAPQSPLWDPTGQKLYPDEGDALKRGWTNSRYVTRRVMGAGRLITVPVGFLAFASDNADVPVTYPYPEGIAQLSYVWHAVPFAAIPFGAISRCLNAVNSRSFDFAEPHTLMLTTYEYDAQPGPLGPILADVRYQFLYTPRVNRAGTALGHAASLRVFTAGVGAPYVDYDAVGVKGDTSKSPLRGGDATSLVDPADLFRPAQPTG